MSQDIDAELDALGSEPEDLARLIAEYADGVIDDLGHVDVLLGALGEVSGERLLLSEEDAPATVEQPLDEAGPQSGEYSLGPEGTQTSADVQLEVSGEMELQDERSGSHELPTAPADDGASEDPAGAMAEALHSQVPDGQTEPPDTEQVEIEPFGDDEEEATMVGAPPDVTQVAPTDPFDDALSESEVAEDSIEVQTRQEGDLDALFNELTSPSSRPPPPSTTEDDLSADADFDSADAALGQRDAGEVDEDLARFAESMSLPPKEDGYEDDEATAVFDAAQFKDLEQALAADEGLADEVTRSASSTPPPPPPAGDAEELSMADLEIEEIDASDLEVVFDDEGATDAPPRQGEAEGGDSEAPAGSARPSLLGRLLGRKNKE